MKLGICAHPDALTSLADMPFDYIEGNVQGFLVPEAADEVFAPNLEAVKKSPRPMPALNCFLPGNLKVSGPSVDFARLERYAESACARAKSIGAKFIVFGSGGARQIPDGWSHAEGFEQYVEALRVVGPIAARHGVTVVVEPLNRGECNLVNTVLEGAVAVARANQPAVRLLVDFYHMLRNDESPDDIVKAAPWIAHAHLAEKEARTEPGARGDDFRPFLRALRRGGYEGALTLECGWSGSMADCVSPAFTELRRQLADSGY